MIRRLLRRIDPQLPRPVWVLQAGGLANSFGNGVAYPFLLIYLHNVRGIPVGIAGLVAATNAAVGLVAGPVAGTVIDRIGARATLGVSLCFLAAGFGGFPLVRHPWEAFAFATCAGIGNGGFWPSQSSLISWLTPRGRLHGAFAQQRVSNNLGIGLGGIVGGLIATTADPGSFTILFSLDAATFLVFLAILRLVPAAAASPDEQPGRYRDVLRHRAFLGLVAMNTAFVAVGYGLLELLPLFGKDHAGISETEIGLIFFVNTIVIVVAQLPIARLCEGHRRMLGFALMGVLWAVAWLIVLATGLTLVGVGATAVFAVAAGVFGIGECLHGTVQGALVADLAPPRLLGRYMALSSFSWQGGLSLGTAAGGFVLAGAPEALWAGGAVLALGCSGWALALERSLPGSVRRTPLRSPVRVPEVTV